MTAAVAAAVVGLAFLLLGRWGRANQHLLVAATLSDVRREREERSIRRGARSCLVLGAVFLAFAVLQGVEAGLSG